MVPVFSREAVLAAVSPLDAYDAVRDAFTADLPDWLHSGPEESCTPAGS